MSVYRTIGILVYMFNNVFFDEKNPYLQVCKTDDWRDKKQDEKAHPNEVMAKHDVNRDEGVLFRDSQYETNKENTLAEYWSKRGARERHGLAECLPETASSSS